MTMDTTILSSLPMRGLKRQAPSMATQSPKKMRLVPVDESESDESSSEDIDSDTDGEPAATSNGTSRSSSTVVRPKNQHCPYADCKKSFNRPARLRDHLRSHTNTRPFVCPHSPCTKDFLRETHLKAHLKSAHSDVRDYTCQYEGCGKAFATNTRLKRHHAAHEGREKHKCSTCGQEFRKHSTLQKHVLTVHEEKKPFVCELLLDDNQHCGEGFDRQTSLKSHQARVHGDNRYFCNLCHVPTVEGLVQPLGFATYTEFMEHNKLAHPPSCSDCDFTCVTPRELRRHMELAHGVGKPTPDRSYICSDCGQAFTKKGNMTVHIRTVHSLERRFVCGAIHTDKMNNVPDWDGHDACGKDFKFKSELEEHTRTVHLGMESKTMKAKRLKVEQLGETVQPNDKSKSRTPKSAIGLLTGTAYEENPARHIACLIQGCNWRFTREYDLEIHLQAKHGFTDLEVTLSRTAPQGEFEFGINDEEQNLTDQLEQNAVQGGEFWMGGSDNDMYDDWEADEAEMHGLIHAENDRDDDETMIDPAL